MQQAESSAVTLGTYLRSLREAKGSSLEDMARSTRVGIRHLEALEEERLVDLPSPVFVRGFIRAYCSFLRESPDTALAHYQDLAGERAALEATSTPPRARNSRVGGSVLLGIGLLLVLGVGLIVLNLTVNRQGVTDVTAGKPDSAVAPSAPAPAPPAPKAAMTPPAAPPASPAPAPEPSRPASPAPPAAPPVAAPMTPPTPAPPSAAASAAGPKLVPGSQRLVIKAVEPTWVRVQTDEGRIAEELLPAGASREWTADRRFLVTIGNAGGVEVTLNGRSLPPLGAKGTVIQRLELPQLSPSGS